MLESMKKLCLFPIVVLLMFSCQGADVPERRAEEFLSAFLSCRFAEASEMCSPEVVEAMRWRASQLSRDEAEAMVESLPDIETTDVQMLSDDSCVVTCLASDAFVLDSIDQPGHIGNEKYCLVLKKEKGSNWKVTALISNP